MLIQSSSVINKKKFTYGKYYRIMGWLFILPFTIFFLTFTLFPILNSIILTFQTVHGLNSKFVGFNNYIRLFKDSVFWGTLGNTFLFLLVQIPATTLLAIIISVILNSDRFPSRGIFRTGIFLPCVTSLVAYSLIFKLMFSNEGLINSMLGVVGIPPIMWLNDSKAAKLLIIIALVWRWTGYHMMFYLAALQNIPKQTIEAAQIDGANAVQKLFYITIPQLKPIILFLTVLSTIGTLQLFDEPMNLTNGGPGNATMTISMYIYNQAFVYAPNFGYAATLSYILVLFIVILSVIQFKVTGELDYEA